ncbi:MAG TPA: SUMF1/EgtB/PvdO family nonheme iron enzyme [Thermoanaerobaculia bacterium]
MKHLAFPDGVTRDDLVAWYRTMRARTRSLFDLVTPDSYYERPIALRNPIVFYEGHIPAFAVNTLLKLAMKQPGIDEQYERIFERGIDPEDETAVGSPTDVWPSRRAVQAYGTEADARIEQALASGVLEDDGVPQLRGGEAALTILEHELMHQETLLYMFHNLPYDRKVVQAYDRKVVQAYDRKVAPAAKTVEARTGSIDHSAVRIPAGRVTLGAPRDGAFGWDNEFPHLEVHVDAFEIGRHNVTNGDWLAYMKATGAPAPHFWVEHEGEWRWRGMFALLPLNLDAPVYVTHDEAARYAAHHGKRLPSEAEYHRAAYGTPGGEERAQPWGDAPADATRGNFDFAAWDPVSVGSFPEGASAWGVHDLIGNGWEWTSTVFDGFPGFAAMPSYALYSTDFFDGAHYVIKGASPATARQLVRRPFRNWFRSNYPYVYATFRCVR